MTTTLTPPRTDRVRHELRRRTVTVTRVERLTPHMIRLHLAGPALADFPSAAPDDHCKVVVPLADGSQAMRDYTPRRFDREAGTLVIDFAVHEAGPATAFALAARPGDSLTIAGPRGSRVISGLDRLVLIGDETALPAIGRWLEEAEPGQDITTIVAVPGPEDRQSIVTRADHKAHWVHRPVAEATDPAPLLQALAGVTLGEGTFLWIAAEGSVARALRQAALERGHPLVWTKTAGYWIAGEADKAEKFDD